MTDDQYLELFKISDKKYLIGIFQDGITVHKQMTRTLNIFSILYEKVLKQHRNDDEYFIGIIGGGIAGLTFAAAALKAGFRVKLFEEQPIYLHMQTGCDIRVIHPNIYEWPDAGYNNPYAEMPVLDWKYDSASNVVKQIIEGWEKIRKEKVSQNRKGYKVLAEFMNCKINGIGEVKLNGADRFMINFNANVSGSEFCDLLIYATGYGIETGVNTEAHTPSYWRNDSYAQTDLENSKKTWVISGVGDGGLIDLFRLAIFGFDYEMILGIIQDAPDFEDLLPKLQKIKEDIEADHSPDNDLLFKKFTDLDPDYYNYIFDELNKRDILRKTDIWLNDKKEKFEHTLNHKRMSFLHAFLAFILMRNGNRINLQYKGGEMKEDNKEWLLNGTQLPTNAKVIIRQGTQRMKSIPDCFFDSAKDQTMKSICDNQKKEHHKTEVHRRWSNSGINAIFDPANYRRYEYLNPSTSVLCTNYISGLAGTIKSVTDKQFRLTLHRLIKTNEGYSFQQVTAYFGTNMSTHNESYGRVFNINRGGVGLSFHTGLPLLIVNRNETAFKELANQTELTADYSKISKNKTFLNIPILATGKNGRSTVNMVLFLDSTDKCFFGPDDFIEKDNFLLKMITAATSGFIASVAHHLKFGEIKMVESDFEPLILNPNLPDTVANNICCQDISTTIPTLSPITSALKFNSFYSFTVFN